MIDDPLSLVNIILIRIAYLECFLSSCMYLLGDALIDVGNTKFPFFCVIENNVSMGVSHSACRSLNVIDLTSFRTPDISKCDIVVILCKRLFIISFSSLFFFLSIFSSFFSVFQFLGEFDIIMVYMQMLRYLTLHTLM